MCAVETLRQRRDSQYVSSLARQIVQTIPPDDEQARVLALRDYLRAHVSFRGAVHERRHFFRDSASKTLLTGKGYCGEVTRAFVRLAAALGIRAQRVYLYGKFPHVVAEVEVGQLGRVIVDSQNPPQVDGLPPLEQVMQRPEYRTYSNLNMRRLRLSGLITSISLEMNQLSYWLENPHGLQALLWACLVLALGFLRFCWTAVRVLWWHYYGPLEGRFFLNPKLVERVEQNAQQA
jgi:hypothetical protein